MTYILSGGAQRFDEAFPQLELYPFDVPKSIALHGTRHAGLYLPVDYYGVADNAHVVRRFADEYITGGAKETGTPTQWQQEIDALRGSGLHVVPSWYRHGRVMDHDNEDQDWIMSERVVPHVSSSAEQAADVHIAAIDTIERLGDYASKGFLGEKLMYDIFDAAHFSYGTVISNPTDPQFYLTHVNSYIGHQTNEQIHRLKAATTSMAQQLVAGALKPVQ